MINAELAAEKRQADTSSAPSEDSENGHQVVHEDMGCVQALIFPRVSTVKLAIFHAI